MEKAEKPRWRRPGVVRRTYDFEEKTLARLDRAAKALGVSRVALLELIINRYCMTEKERQEAKDEYGDIWDWDGIA